MNHAPSIAFDPFLPAHDPFGAANATMWLASADGTALGYVEKAGAGRYSAHARNTFFGPFATREEAGRKLFDLSQEKRA